MKAERTTCAVPGDFLASCPNTEESDVGTFDKTSHTLPLFVVNGFYT